MPARFTVSIALDCPSEMEAQQITETIWIEPSRIAVTSGLMTTPDLISWVYDVIPESERPWAELDRETALFLASNCVKFSTLTKRLRGALIICALDDELPTLVGVNLSSELIKAIARLSLSVQLLASSA